MKCARAAPPDGLHRAAGDSLPTSPQIFHAPPQILETAFIRLVRAVTHVCGAATRPGKETQSGHSKPVNAASKKAS